MVILLSLMAVLLSRNPSESINLTKSIVKDRWQNSAIVDFTKIRNQISTLTRHMAPHINNLKESLSHRLKIFSQGGTPDTPPNVPPAYQYNSKLWMVHHADEIMRESRQRQAEWSGATLPMSNTVPPPADIVHSTPFYSEVMPTGVASGIGVERAGAKAPGLFGTFTFDSSMSEIQNNRKNIELTTKYEGGRNTPRSSLHMVR